MFSKLMRPLITLGRSKGLKAVIYLDNGICAVKGKIEAKKASAWVKDALECAGLVVHEGKSVWFPSLSVVGIRCRPGTGLCFGSRS